MTRLNNKFYAGSSSENMMWLALFQVAMCCPALITQVMTIFKIREMMSILHSDMEDDTERHGFYEVAFGKHMLFREGDEVSLNNQMRFAKGQKIASDTVVRLYAQLVLTVIYMLCSLSLAYGAKKCQCRYMVPWIVTACIVAIVMVVSIVIGSSDPNFDTTYGGFHVIYLGAVFVLLMYSYTIYAVSCFAMKTRRIRPEDKDRGERLILLDHEGNSSRLSTAQLQKLSTGNTTHFV